jgi:hypothetical protein
MKKTLPAYSRHMRKLFYFNKGQRRGILLLLLIVAAIIVLRWVV